MRDNKCRVSIIGSTQPKICPHHSKAWTPNPTSLLYQLKKIKLIWRRRRKCYIYSSRLLSLQPLWLFTSHRSDIWVVSWRRLRICGERQVFMVLGFILVSPTLVRGSSIVCSVIIRHRFSSTFWALPIFALLFFFFSIFKLFAVDSREGFFFFFVLRVL